MKKETIYELFITDQNREILQEEPSIDLETAERIIRDYPWQDQPKSYVQVWKRKTKFSLSVCYLETEKKFQVGFSDRASVFKLPLPYFGAKYGILENIDQIAEPLKLFFDAELNKLEQFLEKHRAEQKGD